MKFLLYGIHAMGDMVLQQLLQEGLRPQALVTKADVGDETSRLVKRAEQAGIPVWQPSNPSAHEYLVQLESLDLDLAVVAGYHKKLPEQVLQTPRMGTINIHGSLLPKYRGPSTWKQMIMNGETMTGVTIHVMTPELDRGDILLQRKVPIMDSDTGGSLFLKICRAGAELLPGTMQRLEAGSIHPVPQDENSASYCSYVTDLEARVDWNKDAEAIRNQIRGLSPRPGAWMDFKGERIGVTGASRCTSMSGQKPGTVLEFGPSGLRVATGGLDIWIQTDKELFADEISMDLEALA